MSITRNFLFSSTLTVSGYIFPIIVYPHVARALGVENMGMCNFVDSLIDYFSLFSMLGIGAIGVREIAESRNDRAEMSRRFISVMLIGTVTTLIALTVLIGCTLTIPKLADYRPLLLIGIIKLLGNFLLLDWLYQGLEDFRYITARTVAIKIAYVISVYIWIWVPADYLTYYLLFCLSYGLNALFSCLRASTLVDFSFKGLEVKRILRPILIIGLYMLLTSMYSTFNTVYLGFRCGDVEVGFYTTAIKFFFVLIGLYTAFTKVMIPRMSSLVAEGDREGFLHLADKAISTLLAVAIPMVVFAVVFAEEIIYLFSGEQFLPAAFTARIVFPLIVVIGYEQIIILQMLLPLKKDRALLIGSLLGAITCVTANLLLVGRFMAVGSAITWFISELAVLTSAQIYINRYLHTGFPWRKLFVNVVSYVPLAAVLWVIWVWLPYGCFVRLLCGGLVTLGYATMAQVVWLRDEFAVRMIKKFVPFLR